MTGAGWWQATRDELAPLLPDLRVAVYASGGAPYHHAALVAQWGGVPEPLSAASIRSGGLDAYDVLVMPGGGLNAMGGLLTPLGEVGTARIRAWVERGGMYIGSCAGAYLGATLPESFLEVNPQARGLGLLDLPIANAAEGVLGGLDSPGTGVLEVQVTDTAHPLAHGLPEHFQIVHYNGPCFLPDGLRVQGAVGLRALNEAFTPWERSLPGHAGAVLADRLRDQEVQLAVSGSCGEGLVVLFGSHPEFGLSALQLGWGVAARLFANALKWQAGRRASGGRVKAAPSHGVAPLSDTAGHFARAARRFQDFLAATPDLSAAPRFLGLEPELLWRSALSEAADLCARTATSLHDLARLDPETGAFGQWADHEAAPDQDYGFVGLAQLARHIHTLMDGAERHLRSPPPLLAHPYDAWERHPYHLLASSYLSAAGLAASAALAAGTLGRLCGHDVPPPHPLTVSEGALS